MCNVKICFFSIFFEGNLQFQCFVRVRDNAVSSSTGCSGFMLTWQAGIFCDIVLHYKKKKKKSKTGEATGNSRFIPQQWEKRILKMWLQTGTSLHFKSSSNYE